MKVMVLVKANVQSEAGRPPNPEFISKMMSYNEELIRAGVMLTAEGLQPSSKGKRIKFSGSKRTVTDGPFTESKELVAGFWVWKVNSMQEAVDWLKRAPFDNEGDAEVEIREVFDGTACGGDIPQELKDKEQRLRELAESLK